MKTIEDFRATKKDAIMYFDTLEILRFNNGYLLIIENMEYESENLEELEEKLYEWAMSAGYCDE